MKVKKRQWVCVDYETGIITQVMKPTTKKKAIKIFSRSSILDFSNGIIYERMSEIKPIVQGEKTKEKLKWKQTTKLYQIIL